jgi:hypothetical protein
MSKKLNNSIALNKVAGGICRSIVKLYDVNVVIDIKRKISSIRATNCDLVTRITVE